MTPLEALVHDSLLDWLDTEGRPLGESASPLWDGEGERACPFAGSRRGRPMNTAALAQVLAHREQALAALRAASGPTAGDAWLATCALRWAPLFGPRPVPATDAATFKTVLGITRPLTSWLLLSPGSAGEPLHTLVPPGTVVDRLEHEGWLHGSRQVCAAPPERIVEAWEALVVPDTPEIDTTGALVASGLWAVLGQTRSLLRQGVLHEVPGWSPVASPQPGWPAVTHLLAARGPGSLVREVPRFEPRWARHVWVDVPPALDALVTACEQSRTLSDLDGAWAAFVHALPAAWTAT